MKLFILIGIALFGFLQAEGKLSLKLDNDNQRIVGGEPAPVGRYPWIAGMLSRIDGRAYCGGTLITSTVVYTAVHCPAPQFVHVGCYDVFDDCQRTTVDQVIDYPGYFGSPNPGKDFRLIVLSEPILGIEPIGFVADSNWAALPDGFDVTVIGWGATSFFFGPSSDILLETEVDLVRFDECANTYTQFGLVVESNMVCAAREGKDACQGDSGGPLFARCDQDEKDVLVGIVSWGIGCAFQGFPGVYSNVAFADGWFQNEMRKLGQFDAITRPPAVSDFCT